MEKPERFHAADIPERLTKLTIEKLGFGEPYYVSLEEEEDSELPAIFVDPDQKLRMSKSHIIDVDDNDPIYPFGLVGIMKTAVFDPNTNMARYAYIADLRFINDHDLVDANTVTNNITDQDEYLQWLARLNNTVEFEAFIAPEREEDETRDIPEGIFYGSQAFYDDTLELYNRGNEIMAALLASEEEARKKEAREKAKKKAKKRNKNKDAEEQDKKI